jgi:hypothetical protein
MAAIGICTATTTILISLQLSQGMELVQILLIQQVTAGSLFIVFYQPKGFTFID